MRAHAHSTPPTKMRWLLPAAAALGLLLSLAQGARAQQVSRIADNATFPSLMAGLFNPERLRETIANFSSLVPRCDHHLQMWTDGILRGDKWALQMSDASAKLHAELLYGTSIDMGNFDNCESSSSNDSDPVLGAYYLPSILVIDFTKNTTGITKMALCAPQSCDPAVLSYSVVRVLLQVTEDLHKMGFNWNMSLIASLQPYKPVRDPGTPEWVFLGVCASLLILALVGLAADLCITSPTRRQSFRPLLAFSVMTNTRRLVEPRGSPGAFRAVDGIRVMSLMWIVLVHRWMLSRTWPINTYSTTLEQESQRMIFLQGFVAVDTFFVIGGLVSCYSFQTKTLQTNRFKFHRHVVHRLFRVTPALAVCVAFSATWVDLLGRGPLQSSHDLADKCREGWWMSLLYVSNFFVDGQCLPHTWYLSADMQLHILSPLVLLPLRRWPRAGLALILGLTVAACIPSVVVTILYNLNSPYALYSTEAKWLVTVFAMYSPFYTRITPYLVGVLAGHVLFLHKRKEFPILRSRVVVALLWSLSTALALVVLFWGVRVLRHHNIIESAFYNGLFRLLWSLAVSWVIIACAVGCGGPVNYILSCTGFSLLARLSFSAYLVHYVVQAVLDEWKRSTINYAGITVFSESLSDAGLSFIISIVLFVFVEEPFTRLENIMWNMRGVEPDKSPEQPVPGVTLREM